MENSNTVFYHEHLLKNIDKLENRKNQYINLKLSFLQKCCKPIQKRIKIIRDEINIQTIKKDNQQSMIESMPEIENIKIKIEEYQNTNNFYLSHVDAYERQAVKIIDQNNFLLKKIQELKKSISKNKQQYYNQKSNKSSSCKNKFQQQNSDVHLISSQNKLGLPKIIQIDKFSLKKNKYKINNSLDAINMSQNNKNISIIKNYVTQQQSINCLPDINMNIRESITSFDRLQCLFHQCFDKKREAIQKKVSQLQSKLIINRLNFLEICSAINQKKKNISFDQFNNLTCDEIVTLLISFAWLNRKIWGFFAQKRKLITMNSRKLPKIS